MCWWWYYCVVSFTVLKADGTSEFFKVEKLRRSLRRAGASHTEIERIVAQVGARLHDGIRTQEIYRYAFELLRTTEHHAATRYSLRRALFGLGPSGFPFERFLAKLFEAEGYQVVTGITLPGACVAHEIDLAAYNSTHSFIGEAKFHARPGIKTDIQVAMYSYARFLDLQKVKICAEDFCGINEFRLITNTKFTTTVEQYATCVGIKLLSWEYPKKDNLHDHIQRAGIYPITVLSGLSQAQITTLINHDIIICKDLIAKPHILSRLYISNTERDRLLSEAKQIIKSGLDYVRSK
jgi:hypothetical protein